MVSLKCAHEVFNRIGVRDSFLPFSLSLFPINPAHTGFHRTLHGFTERHTRAFLETLRSIDIVHDLIFDKLSFAFIECFILGEILRSLPAIGTLASSFTLWN
ncbi:hypothetical protein ED21_29934 [Erythrobacter sp. SD-21]|nr:hypothetical protein ED21_29934 [Erythrobacter sp. SD-21]